MRQRSHWQYTDDDLMAIYSQDWSNFAHSDRDAATLNMAVTYFDGRGLESIADMSAGGLGLTPAIAKHFGVHPMLGDLWSGYGYDYSGSLFDTIPMLPKVDLFVCTETIEHLRDPDSALYLIRQHCNYLLLSTPIMEDPENCSHGHLWTWEREDVVELLVSVGFRPVAYEPVSIFGIWICE